jgi:Tfp pilus assembly protein PilV
MGRVGGQPGRTENGFGLVEVMLSLSVLLIVLVSTAYLVDNVVRQAAAARERVAATELAEQWLEQLSNAPISRLQAYIARDVQLTAQPTVVGGVPYTVWGHLEWADVGVTHSLCASGNPPQVIRATITVKWNTNQALGETTIINPPYGTVVPGDGFLSIQLVGFNSPNPPADAANLTNVVVNVMPATTLSLAATSGAPTTLHVAALSAAVALGDAIVVGTGASAQTVTATAGTAVGATTIPVTALASAAPPGSSVHDNAWGQANYSPDQFGCVYLLEPVGTYTVTLASPGGGPTFIDWLENLTPGQAGQTVAVAGLPIFVTFHYDEAATVAFSPSVPAPIAGGMPIAVANGANLQPSGIAVAVPAGSAATSAQLFPFSSAYSVWFGDCSAVPPRATMEEPASPATVSVTPKGSSSVSITGLYVLTLAITQTGGGAQAPQVTATVADPLAATDGCSTSNGEVYTLGSSGAGTSYTTQNAILPQTYTVKVKDLNNGQSTSTTMVVGAAGVTVGATTYPYSPVTPIPVTVP